MGMESSAGGPGPEAQGPLNDNALKGLEVLREAGLTDPLSLGSVQVGPGGVCVGTIAEMAGMESHARMVEPMLATIRAAIGNGVDPEQAVLGNLDVVGLVHRGEDGEPVRTAYDGLKKN